MGTLGQLRDDLRQLVRQQQKTTNAFRGAVLTYYFIHQTFWSALVVSSKFWGKEMAVHVHNNVICESECGHLRKF